MILFSDVSLFLQKFQRKYIGIEDLDLEILYIGQAYGTEGKRQQSTDRLKSHTTLQKIYADNIKFNPDSEIWLALCYFQEVGMSIFDGRSGLDKKELNKNDEEINIKEFVNFIDMIESGSLNEKQKVNFTEAALIRYFKPEYNSDFKESFPSIDHSSYEECYDLDLNAIAIEMETMDLINCKFYSGSIEKRNLHMQTFEFHDTNDRKSFFQMDFKELTNEKQKDNDH